MKSAYSKPKVLEHIFNQKYNANNPQPEIPFTRDEVRDAITATGGKIPFNPNNFVKDLTRKGDSDPRSPSAKQAGYFLREGTHSGSMGIFFQDSGPFAGVISISCPPDLAAKPIRTKISPDILDLLRPDESGLLAAIEYGGVLDDFFGVPQGTIMRVQAPVKVQPHELDCFFIMKEGNRRIPIPCEAKSKGNDVLTLNQIVGITAATLQRLMEDDMDFTTPLGVKLEDNGDIFIAEFPKCDSNDMLQLNSKLVASSVVKKARYTLVPKPPKW